MLLVDLDLGRNEVSDLLALEDPRVLEALGWDRAFYAVRDEGPLEDALALIGHEAGADEGEGWEHVDVRVDAGDHEDKTDDGEALARHDGWVYVIGSHYGKKAGPLHPSRQWIGRLHEAEVADHVHAASSGDGRAADVAVQVRRGRFALHRLLNDALAELDLVDSPREYLDAFVAAARDRGESKGKSWAERIDVERDRPLNIEGAAFLPDGTLLLGLRTPVTAQGTAILLGLTGVPAWFEDGPDPEVVGAWWLEGAGSPERPAGIRALRARPDGGLDAVVGSLDAVDKGSLLLEHHPEGALAVSEHVRFPAPPPGGGPVQVRVISEQADQQRIEGIALDPDGRTVLVVDEDHRVHLRIYD